MNFPIALLALAALGPSATAAQTIASPSPTLNRLSATEPAPMIASTLRDPLAGPGLSAYDYLVVATPGVAASTSVDARARIPATALVALASSTMISFCTILVWQRWALQPAHRTRRRKRIILRKMAQI